MAKTTKAGMPNVGEHEGNWDCHTVLVGINGTTALENCVTGP